MQMKTSWILQNIEMPTLVIKLDDKAYTFKTLI